MSEITIAEALEVVRARISRAEYERAELERTIIGAREEERLLQRLLALRRGAAPTEDGAPPVGLNHDSVTSEQMRPIEKMEEAKHPAVQAVVRELAGAGRPLHISDLMRLLRDANVQIPGAGKQANLITHLRRDPPLFPPSQWMYGLLACGA